MIKILNFFNNRKLSNKNSSKQNHVTRKYLLAHKKTIIPNLNLKFRKILSIP